MVLVDTCIHTLAFEQTFQALYISNAPQVGFTGGPRSPIIARLYACPLLAFDLLSTSFGYGVGPNGIYVLQLLYEMRALLQTMLGSPVTRDLSVISSMLRCPCVARARVDESTDQVINEACAPLTFISTIRGPEVQ